jgi:hypothetical protein
VQGTLGGAYLGGNPFFQGAFAPAAQAAKSQFDTTLSDIASKSSLAGRYGSGAMGNLQNRATGQYAQALTNTAGQLAYQNYEAERQRQQVAKAQAQLAKARKPKANGEPTPLVVWLNGGPGLLTHTHTHTNTIQAHTHTSTHAHTHTRTHAHTHTRTHAHTFAHTEKAARLWWA